MRASFFEIRRIELLPARGAYLLLTSRGDQAAWKIGAKYLFDIVGIVVADAVGCERVFKSLRELTGQKCKFDRFRTYGMANNGVFLGTYARNSRKIRAGISA
jgi:hypothetical protein